MQSACIYAYICIPTNYSNATTKCHFVSHLLSIYSHREWGCDGAKEKKTASVLDVTSAAETDHTLYYHKCFIIDFRLWEDDTFSGIQLFQNTEIQLSSLYISFLIWELQIFLWQSYIFHIPPLPTFAFSVYHIQSYCWWCSNFTHVYSCVQSLVTVSHTVGLCGLSVCMLVMNIKAFRKLNTFPHINQKQIQTKTRLRDDWKTNKSYRKTKILVLVTPNPWPCFKLFTVPPVLRNINQ